jgi:elongation factor P
VYEASDLRKGLKVILDGNPHIITEFQFSKPGKGQALYKCKLKNLISGYTLERTYRSGDKFEQAQLEETRMQYLYKDTEGYHFMDTKSFEQIQMTEENLGDGKKFIKENMEVAVLLFDGRPISVELPTFVELQVIKSDPGAKGDTATNVTKPATLETGYDINVPLFVNEGEMLKIDTRTGEYVERVKK